MHRLVPLLVVIALVAAACGRGLDEAAPGTTTSTTTTTTTTTIPVDDLPPPEADALRVWALPEHAEAIGTAAAAFTTALGVEVEVTITTGDQAAAAVAAGDIPDVFPVSHLAIADLIESGALQPVLIGTRATDFDTGAIAAFTVGADVYGVPYTINVPLLFYGTESVDAAPAGFSQIKELCSPPPPPPEEPPGDDETSTTTSTTTTVPEPLLDCVVVPIDEPAVMLGFLATSDGYLFGSGRDTTDVGIDGVGAAAAAATLRDFVAADVFSTAVAGTAALQAVVDGSARFAIVSPDVVGIDPPGGVAVTRLPFFGGVRPEPPSRVDGYVLGAGDTSRGNATIFLLDYLASTATMVDIAQVEAGAPALLAAREAVDRSSAVEAADGAAPLPPVARIGAVLVEVGRLTERLIESGDPVTTVLEEAAASIAAVLDVAGD